MALTTDAEVVVHMMHIEDGAAVKQSSFHPHWKAALTYVDSYARADDPGVVTILPIDWSYTVAPFDE